MRAYIDKKLSRSQIFCWIVMVLIVVWIGALSLSAFFWRDGFFIMWIFVLVPYIGLILYFTLCAPFVRTMRWLDKNGKFGIADDIVMDAPALPRSGIFCGNRAMFSKKSSVIIPYSDVAWVYFYKRYVGFVAAEKAVIVHCKDGKKLGFAAREDEFLWLVKNCITKVCPGVIIGYGTEQKRRYYRECPQATSKRNRKKIGWGIVLIVLGLSLLTMGLINGGIEVAGFILLGVLFGGGIVLILTGLVGKKPDGSTR